MSKLSTRVDKLEARTGGKEARPKLFIYWGDENRADTLARYGMTEADLEGLGMTIWLPETEEVQNDNS